jgi:DNA-binding beta-propeller fold protein YncE
LSLAFAAALAVPGSALAKGWVYTESNDPTPGRNAVLALEYGPTGATNPAHIREFRTKGTGAALIQPGMSVGTLGADQEVTLSADKKWLFAVNQGSDTVAVFKVNKATGTLTAAKGSPFKSGGKAPIALGFNGKYLVVANHGTVAPFAPGPMADFGNPNFTAFRLSSQGKLTKVSSTPAGRGPSQALFSPSGRNVFSTSFYEFLFGNDLIQSLTLSPTGSLAQAPGSPIGFPTEVTGGIGPIPPFLPPGIEKLAFGIGVNPTKNYIYVAGPLNARVAIYRYTPSGALTYVGKADNPGSFAACWVALTSDGKYLYTANSASQDISLFRMSPSGAALTFVEKVKVPSTGTNFNFAIDPTDSYLYNVADHDDPDGPRPEGVKPDGTIVPAPADGNFVEAFRIGGGGRLTPISTTALPVRLSQEPYGLALLRKGG